MGSLEVYYLYEHDEKPVIVATSEGADALIDQVRSESPQEAPILMNIYLAEDPYSQTLDVGVSGDRGVVRYAGRDWPDGVMSTNGEPLSEREVPYFFTGHWRGYPSNSEIPLSLVRSAVREFMSSGGEKPTCVSWQPHWEPDR